MPDSTTAMTTTSSTNATRHDRNVVMKPPSSGPTAAAIAAAAPTRAYTFFCAAPSKLPWMRDCMAGSSSDAPRPPMIAQKMMIAVRLWVRVIASAPIGVPAQPEHVGPLASDQVADLAADQDERRRHQRLQRDGGLDAADGGVQVLDDCRDRHVHQRRVDDQHEHRHRQQDRQPSIQRRRVLGRPDPRVLRHLIPTNPTVLASLELLLPLAPASACRSTI